MSPKTSVTFCYRTEPDGDGCCDGCSEYDPELFTVHWNFGGEDDEKTAGLYEAAANKQWRPVSLCKDCTRNLIESIKTVDERINCFHRHPSPPKGGDAE